MLVLYIAINTRQEREHGAMQMFVTGAMSALTYFVALVMLKAALSAQNQKRRERYFSRERLKKDLTQTIFQVLPIASYFVQTNTSYLLGALKATGNYWMDALKAAACCGMGYWAGYAVRALTGFLSYALSYLFEKSGWLSGWWSTRLTAALPYSKLDSATLAKDDLESIVTIPSKEKAAPDWLKRDEYILDGTEEERVQLLSGYV
jgi:hypothetical protein